MENNIILISGRSGDSFKKEVVKRLINKYGYSSSIDGPVTSKFFNCGEIFTQLGVNQSNKRIHIFQSFYDPITDELASQIINAGIGEEQKKLLIQKTLSINDDFMELLLFGDAIKRADAPLGSVSIYLTMLPYARQDKKDDGRVPISAKLMFDLIQKSFGDRLRNINVCELHAEQEQGFADAPLKTVPIDALFAMYIKNNFDINDVVIVSPDTGGFRRVRRIAELIGAPIAYIDKRRSGHGLAEAENVIGDVRGKTCILVDDIGDSCGSLATAYRILTEIGGAKPEVFACITHALMSVSYKKDKETGIEQRRTAESQIIGKVKLITTNTVPRTTEYYRENKNIYKAVINLGEYFADLVHCNTTGDSFSEVIERYKLMVALSTPQDFERFLVKF